MADRQAWSLRSISLGTRKSQNGTFEYQHNMCADREIVYRAWLLENSGARVLVDTGPDPTEAVGRHIEIPRSLAQKLGSPLAESITHIVLTHGHWDHAGTVAAFPNAEVYLQRDEWDFMRSRFLEHTSVGAYYGDMAGLRDVHRRGRLKFLSGDTTILPGIEVHQTGGHTPGSQIVRVEAVYGISVICGDLVAVADNIVNRTYPGVFINLIEVINGFDLINQMKPDALFTGHDRFDAFLPAQSESVNLP